MEGPLYMEMAAESFMNGELEKSIKDSYTVRLFVSHKDRDEEISVPPEDQAKIAFCFLVREKELKDLFTNVGIKLEVKIIHEKPTITLKLSKPERDELILQTIKDYVLESVVVDTVAFDTKKSKRMVQILAKKQPVALRHLKAMVFKNENLKKYYIVCNKDSVAYVENLRKELGFYEEKLEVREDKVDVSSEEQMFLINLGFAKYIGNKVKSVKVEYPENPCCVIVWTDTPLRLKEEIVKFISEIHWEPLQMESELCTRLFYKNEVLSEHIRAKLVTNTAFCMRENNGRVFIGCRNAMDAENVVKCILQHLQYFPKCFLADEGISFLKRWSKQGKLAYEQRMDGLYNVCCIKDLAGELNSFCATEIQMSMLSAEFLERFGQRIIQGLENRYALKVVKHTHSSVWVLGDCRNCTEGRKFLEKEIRSFTRVFPISCSEECIRLNSRNIERLTEENRCCCQLTRKSKVEVKNCYKVASWLDPIGNVKVTLLNGNPSDIPFDVHIVLSKNGFFPIEIDQPDDEVWGVFLDCGGQMKSSNASDSLGEHVVVLHQQSGLQSSKAVALIVYVDSGGKRNTISPERMREAIQAILIEAERHDEHEIGISASTTKGLLATEYIICNVIEGALGFTAAKKSKTILEIFICCSEEEIALVDEYVTNVFQSKQGYARIQTRSVRRSKKDTDTEVEVKRESLVDIKADVVVNSSNEKLQLDLGAVSKSILKKAGEQLQKECDQLFKDGIQHNEVAVTSPCNLQNAKSIFHVALPDYDKKSSVKNLREIVRICLYQAERLQFKSIAFPALGVGNLSYPPRDVAAAMFGAVEDFCFECIEPKLKKVYFSVYKNDEKSCEAFEREQKRWSNRASKEWFETHTDVKDVPARLHLKRGELSFMVITKEDEIQLPTTVVKLEFKKGSVKAQVTRNKQKTWNDVLYLGDVRKGSDIRDALEKFQQHAQKDRMTAVSVQTLEKLDWPESMQVKHVIEHFEQHTASESCLQTVIICVADDSGVENAKLYFSQGEKAPISATTEARREEIYTVRLTGQSTDVLDKTENEICQILEGDKKPEKEQTNSTIRSLPRENAPKMPTDTAVYEVWGNVTAQLNPGIVEMKKAKDEWDSWRQKIEQIYQLQVRTVSDYAHISGSLKDILNFEDYLENHINQSKITEEHLIKMSEAQYKILCLANDDVQKLIDDGNILKMKYCNKEKGVLFECNKASKQKVENFVRTVLKRNLSNEHCTGVAGSVNSQAQVPCAKTIKQKAIHLPEEKTQKNEICRRYDVSGLQIYVEIGSLLESSVDCLLVERHPRLNAKYGMLGAISSMSPLVKEECSKIGNLEANECKIIKSSRIPAMNVALVGIRLHPEPEDVTAIMLKAFQTVDKYGCGSLALPFLVSEPSSGGLPLKHCAEQYAKAVVQFSSDNRNLKKITFVGLNLESVGVVMSVFDNTDEFTTATAVDESTTSIILSCLEKGMKEGDVIIRLVNASKLPISFKDENVVVVFVKEDVNESFDIVKTIIKVAGELYKKKLQNIKNYPHKSGEVLVVSCKDETGLDVNVIHAVLPIGTLEDLVVITTREVFEKAIECRARSITFLLPGRDRNETVSQFSSLIVRSAVKETTRRNQMKELTFGISGTEAHKRIAREIWDLMGLDTPI